MSFKREDYIRMQFTGLKDKNGKEIYEGDIVKTNETFSKNIIKKVEWIIKISGWNIHPEHIGKKPTEKMHCSHLEVIGNIYENPELLKI